MTETEALVKIADEIASLKIACQFIVGMLCFVVIGISLHKSDVSGRINEGFGAVVRAIQNVSLRSRNK